MSATLELRRVSQRHGRATVLADCDLIVAEGQHPAILGRSGAGKTTVLDLLAGLVPPTSGQVFVDGTLVSETGRIVVPPHRRNIAMVFQDLGLWPGLSVLDNVLVGLPGSKEGRAQRRERAMAALARCGIDRLATRSPGSLSGGEQQRAALARALAAEPRFLFLDEPFAGVDLCTKEELLRDVGELAARAGATIVLVTHDPTEAFALCTHAIVLEKGGVMTHGPWADVLLQPASPLLRAFGTHLGTSDPRVVR
jgi:iron(III) transport system ATP-binding protein